MQRIFFRICQNKNAKIKAVTKLRRKIPSWIADLKLAMNTHHNCGSDMGWVSPGCIITFSGSVRLIKDYVCVYVCVYVCLCMYVCVCMFVYVQFLPNKHTK